MTDSEALTSFYIIAISFLRFSIISMFSLIFTSFCLLARNNTPFFFYSSYLEGSFRFLFSISISIGRTFLASGLTSRPISFFCLLSSEFNFYASVNFLNASKFILLPWPYLKVIPCLYFSLYAAMSSSSSLACSACSSEKLLVSAKPWYW